MTQSNQDPRDPASTISRSGYWLLALWVGSILLISTFGGCLGVRKLQAYKAETERMRQEWTMSPGPAPAAQATAAARPVEVRVRMALDRISEVDPKEGGWTADFRLSFRWTGDAVRPGEHFEVANGKILERSQVGAYTRNGEHAEEYRVTARMTMSFDAARVPIGGQTLVIAIEDAVDGAERLRYVADERSVDIRSLTTPQSLYVTRVIPAVKLRSRSSEALEGEGAARSTFVAAMYARGPLASRYFRIFQALFASVAITMIVFFIKPIHVDPRFGLPVGAFFAAVGNNISIASMVPDTGQVTLVQMVNAIGLLTIFLVLVQSAISLYLMDSLGRVRLSRLFDRLSFVVMAGAYAVLNVILPLAAR